MASEAQAAAALLLLLLACHVGVARGEYSSQSLSTHLNTLLAEYDREVPPEPAAGAASTAVSVALSLDLRHAAIEDRHSLMHLLADLKMNWTDSRLMWNASEWETDTVLVWAERLWKPDVALVNAGGSGGAGSAVLRARLDSLGGVSVVQRIDLSVPLALDLAAWPRDVQEAVFRFASLAHNDDEIQLVMGEYKNAVVVECGAWELVTVARVGRGSWRRSDGSTASEAAWRVVAERRGAALAAAAGAVLAAAVLLLAAAAALPFSQRAPLAACAAFLAATWLLTAIFHIPAAGSTPRVMAVMCGVCVAGAASGAAAAVAARLARRTCAPPAIMRALLSRISAVYVIAPDPLEEANGKSGAWTAAARLLDAVMVAALAVTLLVLVAYYLLA